MSKRLDPRTLHIIDGHSYDRETIWWAASGGVWEKLRGPLGVFSPQRRRDALEWAGPREDERISPAKGPQQETP